MGQASLGQQPSSTDYITDNYRQILKRAGFKGIEIITEQLGDFLQDTTTYWKEIASTYKFLMFGLSPDDLDKFKTEHLGDVESLRTEKGFWLDVPSIFFIAKKPLV